MAEITPDDSNRLAYGMEESLLFIAYEPWETRIAHRFLERCHDQENTTLQTLVIADPLQIRTHSGQNRLHSLKSSPKFSTDVVFDDLLEWQERIRSASAEEARAAIKAIEHSTGLDGVELLIASDLHLVPRERSPYYRRMSRAQALMAAALVFQRVVRVFDRARPTMVVMLDEQYLVKNFAARLAHAREIPIRVFRMARFQRYVKCDPFFLPLTPPLNSDVMEQTGEPLRPDFGTSLYERNLSVKEKSRVRKLRAKKISSTLAIIREANRDQKRKSKRDYKSRPKEYSGSLFWCSSTARVRLYLLLQSFRMLRFVWLPYPFTTEHKSAVPYVLVPLHVRPESSTLTQGLGMEDEQLVESVARIIKERNLALKCLVLEHPSMIRDRRLGFYRSLRRLPGVSFADPGSPTRDLLKQAAGIATISGTAALEGALLDVPVHVVGFPEFLNSISSSGWDQLANFLEAVAMNQGPKSGHGVAKYLQHLEDHAVQIPWSWEAVSSREKVEETTKGLMKLFKRSLDDTSTWSSKRGGVH